MLSKLLDERMEFKNEEEIILSFEKVRIRHVETGKVEIHRIIEFLDAAIKGKHCSLSDIDFNELKEWLPNYIIEYHAEKLFYVLSANPGLEGMSPWQTQQKFHKFSHQSFDNVSPEYLPTLKCKEVKKLLKHKDLLKFWNKTSRSIKIKNFVRPVFSACGGVLLFLTVLPVLIFFLPICIGLVYFFDYDKF